MRKDITKKFLEKEDGYKEKMLSKDIFTFIFKKKINIDTNQISHDEIEFRNVFSTKPTKTNKKNFFSLKNIVEKDGKRIQFNMIYCEEGAFKMGATNYDNDRKKVVEIESSFLLGETEVTQELYELVMGYNPSYFKAHKDSSQRPVECLTWYDSIMFCNKLSVLTNKSPYYEMKGIKYLDQTQTNVKEASVEINEGANGFRLPLEKEWEYAARTDTNNRWSGTDNANMLGHYAWFKDNSNSETHPIKQKKPNEWGFYDMTGNVAEWCWDAYDKSRRSCRGGSYLSDSLNLFSILKNPFSIDMLSSNIGFRVSISLVD